MNDGLVKRILASPQLPTLPVIAMKVLEVTRRDDVSVPEIANVIMTDTALASKILRTVNSPFYGMTKQVSTVSSALVIIGLQAAKTLALGFSLLTNLDKRDKSESFDHTAYWRRCIFSAASSRILAQKLSVIQQEEAFLAGLLGNVGILVLHRVIPDEFDALFAEAKGDYARLSELCRDNLEIEPEEISKLLAEKWQLPQLLSQPIALQKSRDTSDATLKPLVEAVAAGLVIAGVFVAEDSAKAIAEARQVLAERFEFSPEDIEETLDTIGKAARDTATLLDVQIGEERTYQEILDEAQEALVALSLQSQKQVQTIQKQVETLKVKAATDSLTGLPNRAKFEEFIGQQFQRAYHHQRPLSLVFIDIDHFKSVNDTYGHQAGDEVLRRVSKLLRASVRNIDLVARYGGEEFAMVLTETDTITAAIRSEALRNKMAGEVIRLGNVSISITLSAGVAGTDRSRIFAKPEQLTNAADRAVYAAKAAGRNCVRVFKPMANAAIQTKTEAEVAK